MKITRIATAITTLGLVAAMMAGCASASAQPQGTDQATELRLGYFANVTHAPALVGVDQGLIQNALGDVKLSTQVFNAGPAEIEALTAGAIDAAYIGPSPAINSFIQSGGQSAVIVAGAAVGGAALVVRDGINSPADLKGKTLATPQLGNTQDVALRAWLSEQGFKTDPSGGGDVNITPTDNAQTLTLFQQGKLDGAWLPEPWVSRLVLDAGAHVLVNEASLWPNGAFPTTVLLVNADYLKANPGIVANLVKGNAAAVQWLTDNPTQAPAAVNASLAALTGKPLSDAVIQRSLQNVSFSIDPHAEAFKTLVSNGVTAGTQRDGSIDGLFDLRILNGLLKASGAATVSADGLGQDAP
ncbi:ABC transporter substrate-binding protein [Microbacterium sp. X-17]|uniref:ABC transporter substrate-binding protein n=1 Tax=Microbacterium sp. X-17 TaxID=3144404 RepID=UPI0031F54697